MNNKQIDGPTEQKPVKNSRHVKVMENLNFEKSVHILSNN